MEWITNLIGALKIPVKILLPVVWIFSAAMIFLDEKILNELSMLSWSEENGFIFGLLFVISSCFCLVYIFKYIATSFKKIFWKISFKRRTMKKILKLNPMEAAIIIKLYNTTGYTYTLDSTQPVVQVMIYKNLIHSGGTQAVTVEWDNSMPMKYMLQPYVIETLDHYKIVIGNKTKKIRNKLSKAKNPEKINKLNEELNMFTEMYNGMFNGGLENE